VTPGGHLTEEDVVEVEVEVVVVEVLTTAVPVPVEAPPVPVVPAVEAPLDCLEGTGGLGQAAVQAA